MRHVMAQKSDEVRKKVREELVSMRKELDYLT